MRERHFTGPRVYSGNPPGRPQAHEGEPVQSLTVVVGNKDYQLIKQRAFLLGVTMSEYIREAVQARLELGCKPIEQYLQDLHEEMKMMRVTIDKVILGHQGYWEKMTASPEMRTEITDEEPIF